MQPMVPMATDTEGTPASRRAPTASREDTEAILSYYHSDLAGEPYLTDQESGQQHKTTESEATTRQSNSSNDSSPSSPFPCGKNMKNDPIGTAPVHRRKHSNNVEGAADNRRFAIVPLKVDTPAPVPGTGDEAGQYVALSPSASAAEATSPSPSAGRGLGVPVHVQLADSGSALVVPPDTNLSSLYDNPPSFPPTSPTSSSSSSHSPHPRSPAKQEKSRTARSTHHSRSSSRDIGIVGTITRHELLRDLSTSPATPSDYRPPLFQIPSSRSSTPDIPTPIDTTSRESAPLAHTSSAVHVHSAAPSASVEAIQNASSSDSPAMHNHGVAQPLSAPSLTVASPRQSLVSTPDQGHVPPTAASLSPSAYLYYQPGLHSKAGPPPPPPRAMFDIDFNAPPPPRPPRLRSTSPLTSPIDTKAVTPTSITVTLATKPSASSIHQIQFNATPPASTGYSSDSSDYSFELETELPRPDHTIHHTREGAFPPSTILVTPAERNHSLPDKSIKAVPVLSSKDELPSLPMDVLDSAQPIPAEPENGELSPSTARCPELRREPSWVSNSNDSGHASSEYSRHAFEDARPGAQELNGPYPSIKEFAPEDSPSETKRKGGLLTNLKRYSSLPRPPSARSPRMSIFTRSPSPKPPPRIRAKSPDAMRFKDVLSKRSALERAIGYAHKINELSMYDCGLGDWVITMKERGSSKTRLVPATPSQNSDTSLAPRPRHTSRASISSEMTFPLRADAYIATDLSQRDIDTVPSPNVPPPALPYPALAGVTHSTTVVGSQLSHASSLSAGSKVTSGFFSALGRNSITRKDSLKPVQPLRLSKPSPSPSPSAPNPRPVQITSTPSVPGGPRALPTRVQRSRTLVLSSSPVTPEAVSHSPPMRRRSNTLKRPSFFGRSAGPPPEQLDAPTSTESTDFTRQVERLADLLPHADKDVLAGYLRRAGQDILAIGQYLEDEKNGSLRRD